MITYYILVLYGLPNEDRTLCWIHIKFHTKEDIGWTKTTRGEIEEKSKDSEFQAIATLKNNPDIVIKLPDKDGSVLIIFMKTEDSYPI